MALMHDTHFVPQAYCVNLCIHMFMCMQICMHILLSYILYLPGTMLLYTKGHASSQILDL